MNLHWILETLYVQMSVLPQFLEIILKKANKQTFGLTFCSQKVDRSFLCSNNERKVFYCATNELHRRNPISSIMHTFPFPTRLDSEWFGNRLKVLCNSFYPWNKPYLHKTIFICERNVKNIIRENVDFLFGDYLRSKWI